MKKLIFILVLISAFVAGGCGGKPPAPKRSLRSKEKVQHVQKSPAPVAAPEPYVPPAKKEFRLDEQLLAKVEGQFGAEARQRVEEWEEFIRTDQSRSDMERVYKVNLYFNRVPVVDDIVNWGESDYWATPLEFLGQNGGDCEDYAVAKYFTLKAMGIGQKHLFLTYVKDLKTDDFHMVLSYFEVPGIKPLILDNLTNEIKPAYERKDLLPVFNFNDDEVWLAQLYSMGDSMGDSEEISLWQDLLSRIPEGMK